MARFYQTSTPTDVDFVKKVPAEYLMLVAEQEAMNAGQNSLINNIDSAYNNINVYEGSKSIIEGHRNETQSEIANLTDMVMKDGRTPEFLARVSELGNKVANFKNQGLGSKLSSSYENMVNTVNKMRTGTKPIEEDRIQDYIKAVNDDAYSYTDKYNLNPQEEFQDISNKQAFAEFDHNTFLNTNVTKEANETQYINPVYDEEGNLVRQGLTQLAPLGLSFKYRMDEITKEGYNLGAINRASFVNLMNNQDYIQDLQHQFQYRTPLKADGTPYEKTSEGFQEFVKEDAERKANAHALKFAGKDVNKPKTTIVTDELGLERQLMYDKDALDKANKKAELAEKAKMTGIFSTGKEEYNTLTIGERQMTVETTQKKLDNLIKRRKESWVSDPQGKQSLEDEINKTTEYLDRVKQSRDRTFSTIISTLDKDSDAYKEMMDLKFKAEELQRDFNYDFYQKNNMSTEKTRSYMNSSGVVVKGNRNIISVSPNLDNILENSEPITLKTSTMFYRAGNTESDEVFRESLEPNFIEGFREPSTILTNPTTGEKLMYKNKPLTYGMITSGLISEDFSFTSNVNLASDEQIKVGIDLGDGNQVYVPYSYDGFNRSLDIVSESVGEKDLYTQRTLNTLRRASTDLDFLKNVETSVQAGNYSPGDVLVNSNFRLNEQDRFGVDVKIVAKENVTGQAFDKKSVDYYVTSPLGISKKVEAYELLAQTELYSELNTVIPKAKSLNLEQGTSELIIGPNGYPYKVHSLGKREDGSQNLIYWRIPNKTNGQIENMDDYEKSNLMRIYKEDNVLDIGVEEQATTAQEEQIDYTIPTKNF